MENQMHISPSVFRLVANSDPKLFIEMMNIIGLPILGIVDKDPLNNTTQPEAIKSLASTMTEDYFDVQDLPPELDDIKRMAEALGYIVGISEDVKPGTQSTIEAIQNKRTFGDSKGYRLACNMHAPTRRKLLETKTPPPPPPRKTKAQIAQARQKFQDEQAGPQGPLPPDTSKNPYGHMKMPNGQPFPPPPPGKKVPYPNQHLIPKPPPPPPRKK